MSYYAKCNMCETESYINPGADNPPHCPECFTVDDMKSLEDDEFFSGSEGYGNILGNMTDILIGVK